MPKTIALFSLVATPLLIFVSTAIGVYLPNQTELGYEESVLWPFLAVAGFVLGTGAIILLLPASRIRQMLICLYYLAGPAYLLFTILRLQQWLSLDRIPGFGLYLIACLLLAFVVWKKYSVARLSSFFAFLSLLLVFAEIVQWQGIDTEVDSNAQQSSPGSLQVSSNKANVYHIILDAFQTQFFEQHHEQWSIKYPGFVLYEDAIALYDHTFMSIPSVFVGSEYNYDESIVDYQNRAFDSSDSALLALKTSGYASIAYVRKLFADGMPGFDVLVPHANNIDVSRPSNQQAFYALWVYASMPRFAAEWLASRNILITPSTLRDLQEKTFLAASAPQESLLSFRNYLRQEPALAARGRYTYAHLLLPHSPYVFDQNCISDDNPRAGTDAVQQSHCAIKLMSELLDTLKELQRYDDSLIVIHGDHGNTHGPLGDNKRSPYTLMLLKAPNAKHPLRISDSPVSLIDLAQVLRDFAESTTPLSSEQIHARFAEQASVRSHRAFYRVLGQVGMVRHALQEGKLVGAVRKDFPEVQIQEEQQSNIPLLALNQIYEAEDGHLSAGVSVRNNMPGVSGDYVVNGTKSYAFELQQPATIRVDVRVITPNGNSDSNFLRLQGARPQRWSMGISKQWRWAKNPKPWKLPKGKYVFSLEYREPVYLDQIRVSVVPRS